MIIRPFHRFFALCLATAVFAGHATASTPPPAPVEGRDYVLIADGKPFADAKGKIEVAEVFGYWCHFCNDFQPIVDAWKRKLPADVQFTYVPAAFDLDDPFARGFFAAQQLGLLTRTHNALFRAVHSTRDVPMNASASELATFYAGFGIPAPRFIATMASPAVTAQMQRARTFAQRSGISGTPSLIVAGRYRVTASSFDAQLRIVDGLLAQLRNSR